MAPVHRTDIVLQPATQEFGSAVEAVVFTPKGAFYVNLRQDPMESRVLPEKTDRICIVNSNGSIMKYQGKELRFDASEQERAEMILFLLERQALNGPFRIIPLIEQ